MSGLQRRDVLTLLDFVRGADAIGGPRTFAAYVTSTLPQVIPASLAALVQFDLVQRSAQWIVDRLEGLPNAGRVLAAHISDNPFILHWKRTRNPGAVRLSELTTARSFQQTGLYRDFYRPLHLHHALACALRVDRRELTTLTLYRGGSDFSERDRLCLELLRPHLAQLQRNAEAMARTRRDLALVTRGVEAWAHAFVIVGRDGRIRRATEGAAGRLAYYFGIAPRSDHLPARLQDWIQWHKGGRSRRDALPPERQPLVVEREGRRLTVRLVAQPPDSILLLEEAATRLEPSALTHLGLSPREAEVLILAAAGKTNPSIAGLLFVSPRTVQTHLERVYRKLGVRTRTAAAARALQVMRETPAG